MHTNSLPPSDRTDSAPDAPAAPQTAPPIPNSLVAMQEARQRIPGDIVNKATQDLPDNQRSSLRRFHAYYVEHDLSIQEAAKLIEVSSSTISLVFHGRYGAKLDNIVAAINSFFDLLDKRSQSRKLNFIPTKLTKLIWATCDTALEFQKVGFLFSDSQIGKSEALKAYQATHNHGSTIYVEVPTGGCLSDFLVSLAEKLRISPCQRIPLLRRHIINAFDSRMLLIVDEAHRTVDDSASSKAIRTIEFIREIFNASQCAVVICATNAFRDAMEKGSLEKILRQLKRRRVLSPQLGPVPSRDDLNTFAAAYGLPPSSGEARKLETEMVENEALGMWLTLLRMGCKIAAQKKARMDWAHVLSAHKGQQALEKGLA
jgi:hypothetical protein